MKPDSFIHFDCVFYKVICFSYTHTDTALFTSTIPDFGYWPSNHTTNATEINHSVTWFIHSFQLCLLQGYLFQWPTQTQPFLFVTWRQIIYQSHVMTSWCDLTWRDVTWRDIWPDVTWHYLTWHDLTWRDVTWHMQQNRTQHNLMWCNMTNQDIPVLSA